MLILGIFFVFYLLAVFVLPKIQFKGNDSEEKVITCYLKSNGAHVDIVMPIRSDYYDWSKLLNQEHIVHKDTVYSWIAFGWGDKNFYLNTRDWSDLSLSTAFKAAFWLSSGAIHVTYYQDIVPSGNCLAFELSSKQTKLLAMFIQSDFEFDENLQPIYIPTDRVYGNRDAFYNSSKKYSLLHTCNTWVNDALKYSDHNHCFWTVLEFGVMDLVHNE